MKSISFKSAATACCSLGLSALLLLLPSRLFAFDLKNMRFGAKQNYCLLLNAEHTEALEDNIYSRIPFTGGQFQIDEKETLALNAIRILEEQRIGLCMDMPETTIPELERDVRQVHATNAKLGLE